MEPLKPAVSQTNSDSLHVRDSSISFTGISPDAREKSYFRNILLTNAEDKLKQSILLDSTAPIDRELIKKLYC